MERAIKAFDLDNEGDPVAILACGHPQHVRHKPPFINRPWVTSEEGRKGMIGKTLNCIRCDNLEIPEGFVAYKRTSEFTEQTVPDALRKDHSTKEGVWAKIRVGEGKLCYRIPALGAEMDLSEDKIGIVLPEILHSVEPLGHVRFFVEFYRSPDTHG